MIFFSPYMSDIYDDPKEYAKKIVKVSQKIKKIKKKIEFEALAFRGTSGAAMAYPLSAALGIPLLCCRKSSANHSGCKVEGSNVFNVENYAIIDDFIDTGSTIKKIIKMVKAEAEGTEKKNMKCVGIFLYNANDIVEPTFNNIPIFYV